MSDYARALGVTPTHLTRACRASAGMTASELLTRRVVHAVRDLLETTDHPANRVAAMLGFRSAAYFSRFVLQHTGHTPTALRRAAGHGQRSARAAAERRCAILRSGAAAPHCGRDPPECPMPHAAPPRPAASRGPGARRRELRHGALGRREFLARATSLGLTRGGLRARRARPARPAGRTPAQGGTLRIQQSVKAPKDPRSYDWSELGNQTRGFLEYLVESARRQLPRHAAGGLGGQRRRHRLCAAPAPRRDWSNGDPFTAADVARNIARWCDTRVADNSMASRFPGLIDPTPGSCARAPCGSKTRTPSPCRSRPPTSPSSPTCRTIPPPSPISYDGGDPFAHGIGTGPFRPVELIPGERCVLERDTSRPWWGSAVFGGPYLDRVEFLDYGTDPASWAAAARAGEWTCSTTRWAISSRSWMPSAGPAAAPTAPRPW